MANNDKPIYVFIDRYDDMVHLTKEELEELLQQAWNQGYRCGFAQASYPMTYPPVVTSPAYVPRYDEIPINTPIKNPKWEWNTITCNNDITSELRILC